jgi:hypothetical protein
MSLLRSSFGFLTESFIAFFPGRSPAAAWGSNRLFAAGRIIRSFSLRYAATNTIRDLVIAASIKMALAKSLLLSLPTLHRAP